MRTIDFLIDEFILTCKRIYYFFKEKNYPYKLILTVILLAIGSYSLHSTYTTKKHLDFSPAGLQMEKGGTLLKASEFYREGKYYLAIKEFQNTKDTSDFVYFYMANSLMALHAYDEAILLLEKIRSKGSYKQQTEWIYAQALFFSKKTDRAVIILKNIAQTKNNFFCLEAKNLLSSINKEEK